MSRRLYHKKGTWETPNAPHMSNRKNGLNKMFDNLDKKHLPHGEGKDTVSPTLARLRATPTLPTLKGEMSKTACWRKGIRETPNTPHLSSQKSGLKEFFDSLEAKQLTDDESKDTVSPTLARLRSTPSRSLREKQDLLVKKHNEARQNADTLNVGGGVCMWPEMADMRLTSVEFFQIVILCVCLLFFMIVAYHKIHGALLNQLSKYYREVSQFSLAHRIDTSVDKKAFHHSLIKWHDDYRLLLDELHVEFDVSRFFLPYLLYAVGYAVGLGILVYYLIDNMFARSRLSPRRVKNWICLLWVIGGWSMGMVYLLIKAYILETAVHKNVHDLNELQGDLVHSDQDLDTFRMILSYWQTRCLSPTAPGNLYIMGVVAVADVMHYIQYYSLPILTVLIMPVFKLCESLYNVYNIQSR
ncbi:hypothetical protein ScPMuIL_017464 [Solemya velum]